MKHKKIFLFFFILASASHANSAIPSKPITPTQATTATNYLATNTTTIANQNCNQLKTTRQHLQTSIDTCLQIEQQIQTIRDYIATAKNTIPLAAQSIKEIINDINSNTMYTEIKDQQSTLWESVKNANEQIKNNLTIATEITTFVDSLETLIKTITNGSSNGIITAKVNKNSPIKDTISAPGTMPIDDYVSKPTAKGFTGTIGILKDITTFINQKSEMIQDLTDTDAELEEQRKATQAKRAQLELSRNEVDKRMTEVLKCPK
jgi:hypothetical protein